MVGGGAVKRIEGPVAAEPTIVDSPIAAAACAAGMDNAATKPRARRPAPPNHVSSAYPGATIVARTRTP